MNADAPDPDLTELADPALNGLVRALTANGTADELAGRPAALAMFRDSRRRSHRRRFAVSLSSAAAAVVLAGGLATAYTAALPGPVQHIAYRMLGSIGVPDTRPAPSSGASSSGARSSGAPHLAATIPPIHPNSAATCPCQTGSPGTAAAPNLTLVAALTRIPANGGDVFSGRLASGGRPESGVRIRLSEQTGNHAGWQSAGNAVTDRGGEVTLTVAHLTRNASFRLVAAGGAVSQTVFITVIPPVYVDLVPGRLAGVDRLTAWAPFAEASDVVVLQELSGGVWRPVGLRVLGPDHLAFFTVRSPLLNEAAYRVVLLQTAVHGRSVSRLVRLVPRLARSSASR